MDNETIDNEILETRIKSLEDAAVTSNKITSHLLKILKLHGGIINNLQANHEKLRVFERLIDEMKGIKNIKKITKEIKKIKKLTEVKK